LRPAILIVLLALAAFGVTLAGPFHFDDYALFRDPAVVDPGGWTELFRAGRTRPLTYLTFWLNYRLSGRDPLGYHVVNVAVHVVAALLVLRVAGRITTERGALIAAALFAIHPLLTQPVAYVFARGTLLMTVFCLLSLNSWLRGRVWVATALFAAALLSKEECAAFPLVLLLLRRTRSDLGAIASMLTLSAAAGIRVLYAVSITPGAGAGSASGVSPLAYAAAQGPVILRYLRQLIIPWGLSIDPQIGPYPAWMSAACWIGVAVLVAVAARWFRNAGPGFWFIASIVLLLPSSSVLPAADLAADRRMYLPAVALAMSAGMLLRNLDWRIPAAMAAIFCAISIRYSLIWNSEQSLWAEAVARAPRKVRPRVQLARSLEPQRALDVLKDAENIAPEDPAIPSEEGRIYLSAGLAPQALSAFGRALALSPGQPEALQNRGTALVALRQTAAARQDFERALKINPCLFEARLNLERMGVPVLPIPPSCRLTTEQRTELQQAR
jgi:hypothetical protein